MKTLTIASVLIASILANAVNASAASKVERFDGAKFFTEQSNRGGQ